jgi:hypothetical protein
MPGLADLWGWSSRWRLPGMQPVWWLRARVLREQHLRHRARLQQSGTRRRNNLRELWRGRPDLLRWQQLPKRPRLPRPSRRRSRNLQIVRRRGPALLSGNQRVQRRPLVHRIRQRQYLRCLRRVGSRLLWDREQRHLQLGLWLLGPNRGSRSRWHVQRVRRGRTAMLRRRDCLQRHRTFLRREVVRQRMRDLR